MLDINIMNLKKMKILFRSIFITLILGISFNAGAQVILNETADTLPLDSSIRYGRLPNGFTYFIKPISVPQPKIFMRLYNNAGSNLEVKNQSQVAHAVEHLAYRATTNFPLGIGNSERMEKLGMDMYDYITGFSGPRATEFHFNSPQGNIQALQTGLLFFKDIITGLHLDPLDIENVRKEIRQEFLSKVGNDLIKTNAVTQLYSNIFPCNEDYTNFLKPNGNFTSDAVKRFYKDWYRPDLMAISIVGNIENPQDLENQIKEAFSPIEPPRILKKKVNCDSLYYSHRPQFTVVEQEKDSNKFIDDRTVKIHLLYRDPSGSINLYTKQGIQQSLEFEFLVDIISKRLREATNKYQSFDVQTSDLSKYRGMSRTMEILLKAEKHREKQDLSKIIDVIHQLQKYGALDSEWRQYKEKQLGYKRGNINDNTSYWINEISKYYISGEALPANKQEFVKEWLENTTLSEINHFISNFLQKMPEDIGVIVPPNYDAIFLSEKEVRFLIENSYRKLSQPYKEPEIPVALMTLPEVLNLKEIEYEDSGIGEFGAREVILHNGIRVIIKSSKANSQGKKVVLHGFSYQGANTFSKEKYSSALNAPEIVRNSGVNGLNKFELNRYLSTTGLHPGSVSPYIYDHESGIKGEASSADLETLFQLIYLYFTKPNKSEIAYNDWKVKEYKSYIDPSYSLTNTDFENKIKEILGDTLNKGELSGTNRFKSIDKTNLDLSYEIYNQLFGNAEDFTFIITGNFDEELMLSLVRKYLGNLPKMDKTDQVSLSNENLKPMFKESKLHVFPSQGNYKVENVIYGTRLLQNVINPNDWREHLRVEALGEILRYKLWALRFEKGYGLYDVKAAGIYNKDLHRYEIITYLSFEPEEFFMIQKELKLIYQELKYSIISSENIAQALKRMYSVYDSERATEHKLINENFYQLYRYGHSRLNPEEIEIFVKNLKGTDIIEVGDKYIQEENFYEFVMSDKYLNF